MIRTTVGFGLALAGCGSRVPIGEAVESSGAAVTTDITGVGGDVSQGDDGDPVADDDGHAFDDFAGQPPPTASMCSSGVPGRAV